ncbi:MAG TPA: SDR family NAD(P)-dependent oxidoreductase [Armatimonadetes bacterium]|nr:SDR family NAD(P)-dependent oxidoreductase [Armatimonadota bacterium]
MRVLVTGGAGFIGSHLCEKLLEEGYEVYALDDLSTGSLQNILHLMGEPRFHFVLGSILDEEEVDRLVAKCRQVYHLAAVVGVKLVFEDPIRTIEVNVRGTENVLEAALRHGRKVLIASTSEVYGKDVRNPTGKFKEEDDIIIGPSIRWCYACSKALDEYLARSYFIKKGLPVVIARLFNTVGPRQTGAYGMVIPRFVEQALTGKPITVYGDGEQVRSFCWVGDVVEAMMKLIDHPKAVGEVFNVGSDKPITINDLARKVKEKTGSKSPIQHIPYEEAYGPGFEDIRYRVPDISKIRNLIGFEPTLGIDEILERVIAFKRRELGLEGSPSPGS